MPDRTATVQRETSETKIELSINLDGKGTCDAASGIGFLDHMLDLFARHALCDLQLTASGDLHVDAHHTTEDIGICLGTVVAQAAGDKKGLRRFGFASVPRIVATCQ